MRDAAARRGVPLPVIEAIAYSSTHWRMQVADDGAVGPMRLGPADEKLREAATLSGHPVGELRSSFAANVDAGAAWLSARRSNPASPGIDSWRPAVSSLLGVGGEEAVYSLLATGVVAVAPTGERITIAPAPVAASSTSPAARTSSSASSDYPGANWVPADPNNWEPHVRPATPVIDRVVIHVSQGTYYGTIGSFQNAAANASSHYVMRSSDGAATQMVREHDVAWHAGNMDYSMRSIGIEHEGFVNDPSWFTDAMYKASARIVASLVRRYGIPADRQHIIGHNEVPDPNHPGQFGGRDHHTDPGPYWNWNYYMALVRQYSACPPAGANTVPVANVATTVTAVVGMDCDMWVHRSGTAGFFSLGGSLIAAPAVTSAVPGLGPLYVGNGSDHNLYIRNDTRPWASLTANGTSFCLDNPAAFVTATSLEVACEGADTALWVGSAPLQPGVLPVVTKWSSLGGLMIAGPAAALVGGKVVYDVLGTDGAIWSHGAGTGPFTRTELYCYSHPALATSGSNSYFACHAPDGALWYSVNSGTGWAPARSLGGLVGNGVGIAANPAGPTFFGEGLDFGVWERGLTTGWVGDGDQVQWGAAAAGA